MSKNKLPRGIRNNNPLNIIRTTNQWKGMTEGEDTHFCTFQTAAYGFRAAFLIMRTYMYTYNLRTIRGIINRWAPPKGNDTEAYIRIVSRASGINPDEELSWLSQSTMVAVALAMARVENGDIPAEWNSDVIEGYEMAIKFIHG